MKKWPKIKLIHLQRKKTKKKKKRRRLKKMKRDNRWLNKIFSWLRDMEKDLMMPVLRMLRHTLKIIMNSFQKCVVLKSLILDLLCQLSGTCRLMQWWWSKSQLFRWEDALRYWTKDLKTPSTSLILSIWESLLLVLMKN